MAGSKETGQLAYEAYAAAKSWQTGDGFTMWPWNDLTAGEQEAWREAAHAAISKGWLDADRMHPIR